MVRAEKFILFYIGDQQYALPLMFGSKFVEFENLTAVPKVNKNILGLIYHNGNVITIINIKNLLKIKSLKQNNQQICLVFDLDGYHYGILVSQGSETISSTKIFNDRQKKTFKRYIKTKGQSKIYILEPDEILVATNIYD